MAKNPTEKLVNTIRFAWLLGAHKSTMAKVVKKDYNISMGAAERIVNAAIAAGPNLKRHKGKSKIIK